MAAEFVTGIDVGTSSIKAAVLSHKGDKFKLFSFGSVASPHPGMASDADLDLEAVAQAIKNLLVLVKSPGGPVVVALPESKIFTKVISDFPFLSDEELSSAIKYSSEEFVPLPIDQVNLYWQVISRSKSANHTMVFVVASPKNTISKYLKVLEWGKVKPLAVETELVAAARALVGANQFAPTTLIIQLGANSTDFALVSKGMIWFTRSIATGGLALTRALAQYLNFEPLQAEEYKKTYGLLEDQLEGKVFQVLKPLVDIIISEVHRIIQSTRARFPENPIKRIVLSGGGAKLPGLVIYFANNLGLETQEADPWYFVEKDPAISSKLVASAPQYTVAVGLAMRKE